MQRLNPIVDIQVSIPYKALIDVFDMCECIMQNTLNKLGLVRVIPKGKEQIFIDEKIMEICRKDSSVSNDAAVFSRQEKELATLALLRFSSSERIPDITFVLEPQSTEALYEINRKRIFAIFCAQNLMRQLKDIMKTASLTKEDFCRYLASAEYCIQNLEREESSILASLLFLVNRSTSAGPCQQALQNLRDCLPLMYPENTSLHKHSKL